jgi:hypothetical protein
MPISRPLELQTRSSPAVAFPGWLAVIARLSMRSIIMAMLTTIVVVSCGSAAPAEPHGALLHAGALALFSTAPHLLPRS